MNRILLLILSVLQWFCAFSQTYWKIENEYGDEILLTIEFNNQKNTFEAFTRKDALKDIAGSFTFTLAKTAGKLKYPEIVFIEGTTKNIKDSLRLTGTFTYFDKQFPFSASIKDNQFRGFYTDRNRPRKLSGVKLPGNKPINDYTTIINTTFALAEKNLANADWIKSSEWIEFKEKINELKPKIADDYELAAAITWLGKKLPFSPFEISKNNPRSKPDQNKNPAGIRELNAGTALFNINSLPDTKQETDSIAEIIAKKAYTNLILDLRGRNSVTPCAANQFLNLVSNKNGFSGVYLTRKWFSANTQIPGPTDYSRLFKSFAETCIAQNEFYLEPGRFLAITPVKKGYKGKLFVITDNKTSKVSETLVSVLKSDKQAITVGQKTAGSPFLVEQIPVNKQFKLILPVAGFYTSEGKTAGKEGIEPDVKVTDEDALKYIQKNIIK
jgi:hypothetical protein